MALGAERSIVWEQCTDVEKVIATFKKAGVPIYALELTPEAVNLKDFAAPDRLALLLGTEVTGIPPSLLSACNGGVIKITQQGVKESMNVAVAAGIASWSILSQ